jgi:pectate lyase
MSTRVGTLKPTGGRSIWPAAVVVSIVMLTVAVIAVSLDRGDSAPTTTSTVDNPAVASVSGTAANTPSELRGVTVGGRIGDISFVRDVPRRGIATGAAGPATRPIGATPTELSGGMDAKNDFSRYGRHQRI